MIYNRVEKRKLRSVKYLVFLFLGDEIGFLRRKGFCNLKVLKLIGDGLRRFFFM